MTRAQLREMKKNKLGLFVDDGTAFQFSQKFTEALKPLFDGPLGIGNLLPFSKPRNYGDKLHYESAMAGDGSWLRGYTPRKEILVSSRSLFSRQALPAVRIEARA
jgi:hypothetical protein